MSDREEKERQAEFAKRDYCERLYSNWLRVRADEDDPEQKQSDEASDKRAEDLDVATIAFVTTPSVYPWMVWRKLEALELDLSDDLRNGKRADNRIVITLAAIKADLISFGFGHGHGGEG
jgi:hypothetical protein